MAALPWRSTESGDAFAAALHAAGRSRCRLTLRARMVRCRRTRPITRPCSPHEGAVAAPTAGLHFTPALLAALDARGVQRVTLTLHVGAGTFLPVRARTSPTTASTPNTARSPRRLPPRSILPVRQEDAWWRSAPPACGCWRPRPTRPAYPPFAGETSLFILPGHRFRAVDLLLTNFHLPRSTLFMLVCAFAGTARMRAAYAHAVAAGYRFYSYGDACLLELGMIEA